MRAGAIAPATKTPGRASTRSPTPTCGPCATRCRASLVDFVRERTVHERLQRGEPIEYALEANTFDPDRLTVGFTRRLATYKRLHLLLLEPERALALGNELQLLVAGKAHPSDETAKRLAQQLFELKDAEAIRGRVAFLEDYDLSIAAPLVAGCDVWLNLPRRTVGSEWNQRDEVGAQRRPQPQRPRRLVGRGLRRRERLGHRREHRRRRRART